MINGHCDTRFLELKEIFTQAIESKHEVGAALAIEHKGELVVNLWGGHKDAARASAWEEDTLVNVWSVTKGVTATCIAKLINDGLLDPGEKVSKYWPEYGCNGKEHTKVSDILSHRAGMFGFQGGLPQGSWQDWKKFVHLLELQAPIREPGSSQGYHALTFGWLAGELVRRADGRTVGRYFKEEIATPLDIDFHIGLEEPDFARCADMLMPAMDLDTIKKLPGNAVRYLPDFLLPRKLKNFKSAITGADFLTAFQGRPGDGVNYPNTSDWRKAEVPSANGHGSAKALAKLYGILSNGCVRDGVSIMRPETLEGSITPYSSGPDTVLFGSDIQFGLGFELANGMTSLSSLSPTFINRMFGHAGIGGAVAFGDPDLGAGYAFTCNKQHETKNLYKTNNQLVDKLYSILCSG
ncbi:beta-lactamase family protein [Gammaproteobacteria bacterium]|nr:beta-lactamase family protein [Gammaproteobacteria bacterium]MDC1325755.1 beta-lactamase family protein [Gammaproteobacteria bacterium]MDC1475302.1 beta-lactamase family protein [Gammaproteobacteria bacterium]